MSGQQNRSVNVVLNVVARLRSTLAAESEQLRRSDATRLDDFTLRKSQCLLELTRIAQSNPVKDDLHGLAPVFGELCRELEENRRLLRIQLDAAHEVTEVISRIFQDERSDGTYSADNRRGRD